MKQFPMRIFFVRYVEKYCCGSAMLDRFLSCSLQNYLSFYLHPNSCTQNNYSGTIAVLFFGTPHVKWWTELISRFVGGVGATESSTWSLAPSGSNGVRRVDEAVQRLLAEGEASVAGHGAAAAAPLYFVWRSHRQRLHYKNMHKMEKQKLTPGRIKVETTEARINRRGCTKHADIDKITTDIL